MRLVLLTLLLAAAEYGADGAAATERRAQDVEHDDARGHMLQRKRTRLLRRQKGEETNLDDERNARNLAKTANKDSNAKLRQAPGSMPLSGEGTEDVSPGVTFVSVTSAATDVPSRPPSGAWEDAAAISTVAPFSVAPAYDFDFVGPAWSATMIYDTATDGLVELVPGSTITLAFTPDGFINGNGGCNEYQGGYADATETSFTIDGPMTTTLMFCEGEGINDQESSYVALLQGVIGWTTSDDGTELELSDAEGRILAQYVVAADDSGLCDLCPNGLTVDPSFELPPGIVSPAFGLTANENGMYTCKMALDYAATLDADDEFCPLVKLAGMFCCPPGSEPMTMTSTTGIPELPIVTTTEAPMTTTDAPAPVEALDTCVCSPRTYTMRLDLPRLCEVDDLDGNDGVGLTLCVVLYGDAEDDDEEGSSNTTSRLLLANEYSQQDGARKLKQNRESHMSKHQLHKAIIFDVQLLEFGTSGGLDVIHQEDLQVSLKNGDTFSLDSISKDLDPMLPLGEQLDYVPGGVQLTMRGKVDMVGEDGSVDEKIVNQRVTWSYTNDCEDGLPVADGDAIGWVTFENLDPPTTEFCPIAPTTTTTSTTTTTTTITDEPTATPTKKPTYAPTPQMSYVAKSAKAMLHAKTAKTKATKAGSFSMSTFGKSGKGLVADAKTGKDHMAKAHKGDMSVTSAKSSKLSKQQDEPSGKSGKLFKKGDSSLSMPTTSKASKQKEVVDAKAEKGSSSVVKGLSMPMKNGAKTGKISDEALSMPPSSKAMKPEEYVDAKAEKQTSAKAEKGELSMPKMMKTKTSKTKAEGEMMSMPSSKSSKILDTKAEKESAHLKAKVHKNVIHSAFGTGKSGKISKTTSSLSMLSKASSKSSKGGLDPKAQKQESSHYTAKAAKKEPVDSTQGWQASSMASVHDKESEEQDAPSDVSSIGGTIQRWWGIATSYIASWFS